MQVAGPLCAVLVVGAVGAAEAVTVIAQELSGSVSSSEIGSDSFSVTTLGNGEESLTLGSRAAANAKIVYDDMVIELAGWANSLAVAPPEMGFATSSARGRASVTFRVDAPTSYVFLPGSPPGGVTFPQLLEQSATLSESSLGAVWKWADRYLRLPGFDPDVGCAGANIDTCSDLLTVLLPGEYTIGVIGSSSDFDPGPCDVGCGGNAGLTAFLRFDAPVVLPEPTSGTLLGFSVLLGVAHEAHGRKRRSS
jgi:hypothetical protein